MDYLLTYWENHKTTWLKLFILIMLVIAVVWLPHNFLRFFLGESPIWPFSEWGTGDLLLRHNEINLWFSGSNIYGLVWSAVYPPASYLILWPLLNWDNLEFIKILWCSLYFVSLFYFAYIMMTNSKSDSVIEKVFILLIPLSSYSVGTSIGIGQLTILIMPCLLISIIGLVRKNNSLINEILYSILFLFALVKPSVSAPFFWLIIILSRNYRPAFFIVIGYLIMTFVSSCFQNQPVNLLLQNWINSSSIILINKGHMNIHSFLAMIGKEEYTIQSSLIILGLSGIWVYVNRRKSIWMLIGVTAIVARLWTYHWWYDDMLMIIPITSLYIILKSSILDLNYKLTAFILLALSVIFSIAPGGRYLFPELLATIYIYFQFVIWISMMIFLIFISTTKEAELL